MFHKPHAGWMMWDTGDCKLLVFDDKDWTTAAADIRSDIPFIRINATADESNHLAVAATGASTVVIVSDEAGGAARAVVS